ncbi:type 2 isopentenyl-diphosphate Delta-isomerase [Candidatus Micrarchaeota archaeon]|nr:type 2 isopentenyl-diphosphate Delta-isomerase [Candidatus Micrarchaeota archaeon]
MPDDSKDPTSMRKVQHVKIVLEKNVQHTTPTGFDDVHFLHYALPELNYGEINTEVTFLKRKFSLPFMILGMTGGHETVERINKDIALACEEKNIVMGVGSQRAMIEKPELKKTFYVRDVAPKVFLCANVGGYQLTRYPREKIEKMIADIEANALCVHLNPLQEIVQPEGDRNWRGVLAAIEKTCDKIGVPVIAKEVGAGINAEVCKELERAGVSAIDVSGTGGTSWAGIEVHRKGAEAGNLYWNWGVPTVIALQQAAKIVKIPLIASGGVRNGLHVAKAIRLGATLGAAASPFLKAQNTGGSEGVRKEIEKWKTELKIAMFLTRSKDLQQLKKAKMLMQ